MRVKAELKKAKREANEENKRLKEEENKILKDDEFESTPMISNAVEKSKKLENQKVSKAPESKPITKIDKPVRKDKITMFDKEEVFDQISKPPPNKRMMYKNWIRFNENLGSIEANEKK